MNQEKIGKFIAERRKALNLTQAKLAEIIGVSDRSVSKWENGKGMPDLSLFKNLCKELDISINELMSGEKIAKEEYQYKFEENILDLNLNTKKSANKMIKIVCCALTFLIIALFGLWIFYDNYEMNVKFDKNLFICEFKENQVIYKALGVSVLNGDYIEKDIDGKKVYIFRNTINLYNKRRSNWEYAKTLSNYLETGKITFGSWDELDVDFSKYDNIIIYYTNIPLRKLKKLTEKDLKEELKNMDIVCSYQ